VIVNMQGEKRKLVYINQDMIIEINKREKDDSCWCFSIEIKGTKAKILSVEKLNRCDKHSTTNKNTNESEYV